jgi:hypothetical protein
VPVRGVEPMSLRIQGERLKVVEGRLPTFGADEVIVGVPLSKRVRDCRVGDTLLFNVTPFKVVGLFTHDGAYASEVWGDVVRITGATQRPFRQRLVALRSPGIDAAGVPAISRAIEDDPRTPMKLQTEKAYFAAQTSNLGGVLTVLATILTTLMGTAAVLGAVNTMLAAVGARTREVGILVALGYRGMSVFLLGLVEAALIGAVGPRLPDRAAAQRPRLHELNTFTEVAFARAPRCSCGRSSRDAGPSAEPSPRGVPRAQPTAALRRLDPGRVSPPDRWRNSRGTRCARSRLRVRGALPGFLRSVVTPFDEASRARPRSGRRLSAVGLFAELPATYREALLEMDGVESVNRWSWFEGSTATPRTSSPAWRSTSTCSSTSTRRSSCPRSSGRRSSRTDAAAWWGPGSSPSSGSRSRHRLLGHLLPSSRGLPDSRPLPTRPRTPRSRTRAWFSWDYLQEVWSATDRAGIPDARSSW